MASRQLTRRTSFLRSHLKGGRFNFGSGMKSRSHGRMILTTLILLVALLQFAPFGIGAFSGSHHAGNTNGGVASELTAATHAIEPHIASPTVIARVGCIDSRAWETNPIVSGLQVAGRSTLPSRSWRDDLTSSACAPDARLTLVNLNVRLQI